VFDKNDVGIVAMAFAHYMTQYGHDGPPETASAKQSIKGSLCHESGLTMRISSLVCHEEPVIDLQGERGVSAALVWLTFDEIATKINPSASRYSLA